MKQTISILIFLICIFCGIYCTAQHIKIVDHEILIRSRITQVPILTGNIYNASPEELKKININYTLVVPTSELQSTNYVSVAEDGSFKILLDYPFRYQQLWLEIENYYYAGLILNSDLHLNIDLNQLMKKTVQFAGAGVGLSGNDAALNSWYAQMVMFRKADQSVIGDAVTALRFEDPEYLTKLDSLFSKMRSLKHNFSRQVPSPYDWVWENEMASEQYQKTILHHTITEGISPLPTDVLAHRPKLISNAGMLFNQAVYNYIMFTKIASGTTKSEAELIDSMYEQPYGDMLKLQIFKKDLDENIRAMRDATPSLKDSLVRTIFEKRLAGANDRLQHINTILSDNQVSSQDSTLGELVYKLPFKAKLYEVNDSSPDVFLKKLRIAFKNRAIILDFWATWCLPCLNDMPFSSKLHKDAAGLPIDFVYICTSNNSSSEKWKNKIVELEQQGIHIFMNEKLATDLMKLFGKSGFPSYVCFDQNGEIKSGTITLLQYTTLDDIKKSLIVEK